jgi:hypothetical protein
MLAIKRKQWNEIDQSDNDDCLDGALTDVMKKNIRAKVQDYIQRAEKIQEMLRDKLPAADVAKSEGDAVEDPVKKNWRNRLKGKRLHR